jgi:hypothetical protein
MQWYRSLSTLGFQFWVITWVLKHIIMALPREGVGALCYFIMQMALHGHLVNMREYVSAHSLLSFHILMRPSLCSPHPSHLSLTLLPTTTIEDPPQASS